MPQDDVQPIRLLLERINDAWLKGAPDAIPAAMAGCFHDQATIQGPGFQPMGPGGKEACIQSYVDFMRQAQVRECTLSEPAIQAAGGTAVATYSWQMTYVLAGQEYRESGHDVFVFTRSEGRWLALWRAMLPDV